MNIQIESLESLYTHMNPWETLTSNKFCKSFRQDSTEDY